MKKFSDFLEQKLLPIFSKIGAQRHLVAIRDSFAATMPLIMAGAFAVMMNNVFFVPWGLFGSGGLELSAGYFDFCGKWIAPIFSAVAGGTFSILSLAFVAAFAYIRAESEDHDRLTTLLIAVGAFFVLGALESKPISAWEANYLAAQGIFIAMLGTILVTEVVFYIYRKNWTIKMPASVPPAVGRAFAAIIPGFVVLMLISLIRFGIVTPLKDVEIIAKTDGAKLAVTVFTLFEHFVGASLLKLGNNFAVILLISFLIPFLWFFGLHGANMVTPIMGSIWGTLQNENIQNFGKGITDNLHPWVQLSFDIYAFHGGSGATLTLIIAILIFGKKDADREIAKLSAGPGVFQINEPVLFGLPVVLAPVYFIPFVLIQPILITIGYLASVSGFAGPVVNAIPWTTPPVLNAFLATNGSIGAVITQLVCIGVSFVLWVPFVLVANRQTEEA